MNNDPRQTELQELKARVAALESELRAGPDHWQATPSYFDYHATSGFMLGMFGAIASLLFNVVGSLATGRPPLRLIEIYLTFPLGENAISDDFDSGLALSIGCCLYIATGMVLGVPFQVVMARAMPRGTLLPRLCLATVLGLLLWAVNFYLVLSWLQPLLFGGNWITDPELLPPWVGAATHVVFAWTMALLSRWGQYEPYRRQTEAVESETSAGKASGSS